jgi:hypothetical protein
MVDRPYNYWLAGWLAACLPAWLAGFLAGWLPGWLPAWLAGCLAAWLPGRLAAEQMHVFTRQRSAYILYIPINVHSYVCVRSTLSIYLFQISNFQMSNEWGGSSTLRT